MIIHSNERVKSETFISSQNVIHSFIHWYDPRLILSMINKKSLTTSRQASEFNFLRNL
jgi:hypothetical protein